MVNQIPNYILFLMLFLSVVVKVKGETCTQNFRPFVDTPSCDNYCKGQWSDGNGICESGGLCICKFPCGGKAGKDQITRKCSVSTGFCNDGASACNSECGNRYYAGIGYCDGSIYPQIPICYCQYVC
ncbi:Defensin fusion [Medicago truncatula]|uniref:Defensin-like protein n=1 Tax=Medicago truncatula TaxID=3880 RepID=A0A072V6K2_MEDTR|nr:Defensin fusion [Medicago truncatula]